MNDLRGEAEVSETYRLAIVGSRDYAHPEAVRGFVAKLHPKTVVISGGARGVDTWAIEAARAGGLEVEEIPADCDRHGRAAGYIRNVELVRRADGVVAFWDGQSRDTKHAIGKARAAGKLLGVFGQRKAL